MKKYWFKIGRERILDTRGHFVCYDNWPGISWFCEVYCGSQRVMVDLCFNPLEAKQSAENWIKKQK